MLRYSTRCVRASLQNASKAHSIVSHVRPTLINSRTFVSTTYKLQEKSNSNEELDSTKNDLYKGIDTTTIPLTTSELLERPDLWKGLPKEYIERLSFSRAGTKPYEEFANVHDFDALMSTSSSLTEMDAINALYDTRQNSQEGEMIMDDENETELDDTDDPYFFDDDDASGELPQIAQSIVEDFRDQLKFNRVAAYEMPHLVKLRQTYVPPTDDEIVQYRYTTFLGENHPAERKVVLSLNVSKLKLTDAEAHKFKLLAGVRYDYKTDIFKMSTTNFIEPTQNATYLSDILDDLVAESKRNPEEFADVPLDIRHVLAKIKKGKHVSIKKSYKFPEEWKKPQDEQHKQLLEELAAKKTDKKHSLFDIVV